MGCEQSSQYQKLLVRCDALSVAERFNYTLATNNNNFNGNTAANNSGVDGITTANLYAMTDSDGVGKTDTTSTTQFISDANVVSATIMQPAELDNVNYLSASDSLSQEIKDFLAKPTILITGTLTSTDTVSTFTRFSSPTDALVASSLFRDKLKGFLGWRYTIVIRLVVNANRFQQGRYNLYYMPMGGSDIPNSNMPWANDHYSTLVQRTTLPHVELDLSCDTEATLRVPFNSALNYTPMYSTTNTTGLGTTGLFGIYPYVRLSAVAGNLSCGYTIYVSFEDVVLINAGLPQSGVITSKRSKSATEVEQSNANIGPLSSSLIRVRDAATLVGKIPLLSSYANSVSWFADIMASAAKIFGWRKPIVLSPSLRITQNYLPYSANTDGPDMSFPLSLSYENQVGMATGFSGTNIDEMDFSYLCTIPVWRQTVTWDTSQVSGTVLDSTYVGPMSEFYSTTVNSQVFYHYSPLQFIGAHFMNWRGSMVYRFKLVKTEFHSGRLLIVFNPIMQTTTINLTNINDTAYLHRQIIDIRETSEFTFVVPYMSEAPYASLVDAANTGIISVYVMEPLVAPATVSTSISIICESCGGSDTEFAVPRTANLAYYSGITPQSGVPIKEGSDVCRIAESYIGASAPFFDSHVNALHCVGEKITSLRSLIKLPQTLIPTVAPTPANYLHVLPFGISSGFVSGVTNTVPTIVPDFYSNFASCYVYSRGGVRLKYLDNVAVTATQVRAVALVTHQPTVSAINSNLAIYSATTLGGDTFLGRRTGMPTVYYKPGYSGEVQVPQYGRYHSRVNEDAVVNVGSTYQTGNTSLVPRVYVTTTTQPPATVDSTVLRAGADDLNFGGFLSVPPMATLPSY